MQGLFARIRASRAQATDEARKALSDTDQPSQPDQSGRPAGHRSEAAAAVGTLQPALESTAETRGWREHDAGAEQGLDLTTAEGAHALDIAEGIADRRTSRR